jgi:hypothetical protein
VTDIEVNGETCGLCHEKPAVRHQEGWGYLCEDCDKRYHEQMREFRERVGLIEEGQTSLGEVDS